MFVLASYVANDTSAFNNNNKKRSQLIDRSLLFRSNTSRTCAVVYHNNIRKDTTTKHEQNCKLTENKTFHHISNIDNKIY